MATNARTASNVANFSGGTPASTVKRAKTHRKSPLLAAMQVVAVEEGYTAHRTAHLAQLGAAATLAENSTSITALALPTVTAVSSTLISIYIALARTSESDAAQDPVRRARIKALLEMMVEEQISDYITHDGTNGVAPIIGTLTAVGTSGAPANVVTDRAALQSLVLAGGHSPTNRYMLVTDIIGFNQRKADIEASGGTMSSGGLDAMVLQLLGRGEMPVGLGATPFSYDQFDYWVVNGTGVSELYNDGTDTYDLLCSYPSADNDSLEAAQAALVLAGRRNPALARSDAEIVFTISNIIGVARWMLPLVENAASEVYVATYDVWLANANQARAIRRAQA